MAENGVLKLPFGVDASYWNEVNSESVLHKCTGLVGPVKREAIIKKIPGANQS